MVKTAHIIDKKVNHSVRELKIITNISQSIIGTLNLEKVLQIISDGMSELLEIESAAIYILQNDEEIHLSSTTPPLDPNMPDSLRRSKISDHPHIEKALQKCGPIVIPDTSKVKLSEAERNVVDMRHLRSLLYFPFIKEETALGVLILGTCNKAKTYSKHQISLCQTIANQLSIAIQNVKLHNDLKNYNQNLEKTVIERTYELEAANEEYKAINEELETTLHSLRVTQTKLVQSEKMASLGILTAGVAHEINNPLNYIMGAYTSLRMIHSEKSYLENSKNITELLDGLKTGVDRATNIVSKLSQFSWDTDSHYQNCNLHDILDNCLIMLKTKLKDKITVQKDFDTDSIMIKGNVGNLHQVFLNILNNAEQATKTNGTINIKTQLSSCIAEVLISDTGEGIPPENLNRVTDPFFTTKDPGKGTGLGLSIVYNIIKRHKGTLDISSEPGKGTSVKITFPCEQIITP